MYVCNVLLAMQFGNIHPYLQREDKKHLITYYAISSEERNILYFMYLYVFKCYRHDTPPQNLTQPVLYVII